METETTDPHSHDFHVYVDGALHFRVPCGVCEGADNPVHAKLAAQYGTDLHNHIRGQIRAHLEQATRLQHPGSAVVVI